MAHSHQLRVVERTRVKQVIGWVLTIAGGPDAEQHVAQFGQAVTVCGHDVAQGLVHLAVAHLVKRQVNAQRAAVQHPVGQRFFGGGQQQLVAPHTRHHAAQHGPVRPRVAGCIAEHTSVFAHLKQMQVLLRGGSFKLQHHIAPKTNVFLGDGDGVPGQATPTALLDAGTGIFEYELRLVFLLFKLHECTHMA